MRFCVVCRVALLTVSAVVGIGLVGLPPAALGANELTRAVGREILPAISGGGGFDATSPATDLAVALPDGGSLVVGGVPSGRMGFSVVKLAADGQLDRSFGVDGVARVYPATPVDLLDFLRRSDGELFAVGQGQSTPAISQPIVVVALNSAGRLDPSFGRGGVTTLGIEFGGCTCAALQSDGKLILAGNTGDYHITSPMGTPIRGAVIRLTRQGALDKSFGNAGFAALESNVGVTATAVLGGEIFAAIDPADGGTVGVLASLTGSGEPDPRFDGGAPVALPFGYTRSIVGQPDGSVIVGGAIQDAGASPPLVEEKLARYTTSGTLDRGYGQGGIVQLGSAIDDDFQVLPVAGQNVIVAGVPVSPPGRQQLPGLIVRRITSSGQIDPSLGGPDGLRLPRPPFGGGASNYLSTPHPQPPVQLDQNTFDGTRLIPRNNGSFLLDGGVGIAERLGQPAPPSPPSDLETFQPTKNGYRQAVASLTSAFGLDTSFGGPPAALQASVTLPPRTAAADLRRHGVPIQLAVSAIGLARATVHAYGHLIADSVLAIFVPGRSSTLPVETTAYGNAYLKRHAHFRVTVTVRARNLLALQTTATTTGLVP
jgi:uncharacterized delta-60 repeat protein